MLSKERKNDMFDLMKQEWKKIMRIKAVPLLLFVILLISLFYYVAEIYPQNSYSAQEYLNLHAALDKNNPKAEQERLKAACRTIIFEQTLPEVMYTDSLGKEYKLYEQVLAELSQVNGYEDYLAGIKRNAEKKLRSTLFQQQKSYLREAEKVVEDFSGMEGVKAELLPTRGISLLFKTDLQDFFLVLVVFLIAVALVSVELEESTIRLLRCTKLGRKKVVYAKYLTGGLLIVLFWSILASTRFLLTVAAYGTECLSGSIVSLYGASGCTLNITIGQGIVIFFILKLLANLTLYSLILLLALFLQQPWRIYLFAGGPVALFWAAYFFIDANSWMAPVKWLNPVAFLDIELLLLEYRNLILFGIPVNYRTCMLLMCLGVIAICVLLLSRAFLSIMPGGQFVGGRLFGLLETVAGILTGKRSLWGFEFRKWSFYQSGGVICLLLAAAMFLTYSPVADQVHTEEAIYYRYYVKEVEGAWSEDKMTYLYEERKQLASIKEELQRGEIKDAYLVSYYAQQLKKESGLEKAIRYGEYLREKGDGTFVYEQGYERLFGKREPITLFLYRCISVAVMAFLSVLLYGVEGRTGMKQLIQSSYVGEKRIRRYKRGNTLLMGLLVFGIVYLPWFYNVFSTYGTNGVLASVYCLVEIGLWKNAPAGITVGIMLAAYYGAQLVYLWVTGLISGIVAEKIKNPLVAALASFGIGILPVLLFGRN